MEALSEETRSQEEQRSILLKVAREASTRIDDVIWKHPVTMGEFQRLHPELCSSVFGREPPVTSRSNPIKLSQLKAATPSRKSKGPLNEGGDTHKALVNRLMALVQDKREEPPDVLIQLLEGNTRAVVAPERLAILDVARGGLASHHQAAERASQPAAHRTLNEVSPRGDLCLNSFKHIVLSSISVYKNTIRAQWYTLACEHIKQL